jgi:hypothetical protein
MGIEDDAPGCAGIGICIVPLCICDWSIGIVVGAEPLPSGCAGVGIFMPSIEELAEGAGL